MLVFIPTLAPCVYDGDDLDPYQNLALACCRAVQPASRPSFAGQLLSGFLFSWLPSCPPLLPSLEPVNRLDYSNNLFNFH